MDALTTPLPKDWEIKTFRDISTINQGLQIPISQRLKAPTEHAKFYITIQALNNRKEFEYIKTYNESVVCHKDDILMTRTGNTGMVITNIEGVFHNNFFKINFDRTLINKDFLVYFLSLEQTQKTILKKAGTSTIPDLNHNDFYSLSIPLPPLNEQIAIADILSDLDRYLYSLRALILKKESVKKALSFELLSQRKRLKGFNQAWQRVRLGDIAEIKRGVRITKNELDVFGKYPVVSGGVGFLGYTNNFNRYENTITIAQYGTAGFVNWQNQKFWANDVCFCVYPNKDVIKNIFLYYFLKANQNYLYEISNRNATPYSISKDKILDFEIFLPPLNEQIAIADILSALDNEITSLKNKKRQFDNIKKALNHDLMSAKIRVLKK
ncbi:restriction endonuclease subunit S [Helicobacter pylori]|uniref:restriction endonuclease subunit S n=1 Tax=Helicobacter pylori TaxID=210 RepID=UPI00287B9251|nr:restriction endonuclease subunit S [Helicobacter pylori]WNE32460.1 restriction endonuclease subunit S [Helicobacter pylori]WNE33886.1 restriction endonuclease subunit S [Helicobacter pylori]WNE35314.1 restriction endonuclease subunit S [Helicobacter pylori]WNE36741.1 restriction endonuclease subunit S [Helicobacter pylori]WNE38169.1 restriction endonuclease subunit S [Helicobacter pylori]